MNEYQLTEQDEETIKGMLKAAGQKVNSYEKDLEEKLIEIKRDPQKLMKFMRELHTEVQI
jgi:hypothetical protein